MGDPIDEKPIERPRLLVVEGKDELNFFDALLNHMGILNDFDIRSAGGKDQFPKKFRALKGVSGFNKVRIFACIRDAEGTPADSAFRSICDTLRTNGIDPPNGLGVISTAAPKAAIFISPDNHNPGMLEDLVLRIVENEPAMECVNPFIECLSGLEKKPTNLSKSKVLAYLSAMPTDVNTLGVAAQQGYWDFNSPELTQMKEFLNMIHETI
jgi:hypothetical protein